MSNVQPWTQPMRSRVIARFAGRQRHRQIVLAGFRSARTRVEDGVGRELIAEVVAVDDMHPRRQPRSKRVPGRPHRLGRQRIVIARHQEHRRVRAGCDPGRSWPALPRSQVPGSGRRTGRRRTARRATALRRATSRIVAITFIRARDSVFCASSGNDGNRRPEMPVRGVQQPQHDVPGVSGVIRNAT